MLVDEFVVGDHQRGDSGLHRLTLLTPSLISSVRHSSGLDSISAP